MEYLSNNKEGNLLITELFTLWTNLMGIAEHTDVAPAASSSQSIKTIIEDLTGKFNGVLQQDAHEFLTVLIEKIDNKQPVIEFFLMGR